MNSHFSHFSGGRKTVPDCDIFYGGTSLAHRNQDGELFKLASPDTLLPDCGERR
jgi:hypothetical protein